MGVKIYRDFIFVRNIEVLKRNSYTGVISVTAVLVIKPKGVLFDECCDRNLVFRSPTFRQAGPRLTLGNVRGDLSILTNSYKTGVNFAGWEMRRWGLEQRK